MGAEFISIAIKAKNEKELRKQYQQLVENDAYLNGHGGYTGSFAEVPSLMIVADPLSTKKWTKKKRAFIMEHFLNTCIKWEAARAIKTPTGYIVAAWASS